MITIDELTRKECCIKLIDASRWDRTGSLRWGLRGKLEGNGLTLLDAITESMAATHGRLGWYFASSDDSVLCEDIVAEARWHVGL